MTPEPTPEPDRALDFDATLGHLERLVDDLERGDAGLSQALARYEEAVRLLAHCQGALERAERSVALLTGVDAAGQPLTAPFDASATAADTPVPASPRIIPDSPDSPDDKLVPF